MIVQSVKIENFGPFYGSHELELSVSHGAPIVLIHGDNMRGKTSFLNAIRWCLYGKALDRRDHPMPSFRLINYDAVDEGDHRMSVTVAYEHDGKQCQLERHVQSDHRPTDDSDLETTLHLRRDGYFEAAEEIPEIIGDMLEASIARFFLFDGDMLSHYEVLLGEPGRETTLVRESIEQILGLPALQMVVGDLEDLRREAEKRVLRQMRASTKHDRLRAEAEQNSNEIDAIEKDLRRLREQMVDVEEELAELRDRMDSFAEIKAEVHEMAQLEETISQSEEEQKEVLEECRSILSSFWWMPVATRAGEMLTNLAEQAQLARSRVEHIGVLRHEITDLKTAIAQGDCPTCEQPISAEARTVVSGRLADAEAELQKMTRSSELLSEALTRMKELRPFAGREALVRLNEKEKRHIKLGIDIRKAQRQLESIRERLRQHDVRDVAKTEERHERCLLQREQIRKSIDGFEIMRSQIKGNLDRLYRDIQKLPDTDPRTIGEKAIFGSLENIFRSAIDQFRETVRRDVEQEATAIFRELTTEPGYEKLVINEQYGLSIVDSDGRTIGERSAGAEQVVALSLVGALSRCAVREGPVIMDTPFGRLDPHHRKNILRFVPSMSSQVILLVQPGEFDRDRDLVHVAGKVGREYQLVRLSQTQSRFEKVA